MGILIQQNELKELVCKLKQDKKTVVFTNGCFDILHVGHVRYLRESAKLGDILILGLNSDSSIKRLKGKNRPINTQNDRAEVLCALSCVDYVIVFDEDTPENLIEQIKPDIYTKGADYTLDTLKEALIVKKNGGKVEFIELVEGKSTTNTISKMKKCK